MTYYLDILSYTNQFYMPLSISQDFTIEFRHRYRRHNTGTLLINQSHDLERYTDDNLLQFGFSVNNAAYSKFIITEIAQ